jgi:hypothetical protein
MTESFENECSISPLDDVATSKPDMLLMTSLTRLKVEQVNYQLRLAFDGYSAPRGVMCQMF